MRWKFPVEILSLFWLLPLYGACTLYRAYGLDKGIAFLLAVPAVMLVYTLLIAQALRRNRDDGTIIIASTATASLVALAWLAEWGRGV